MQIYVILFLILLLPFALFAQETGGSKEVVLVLGAPASGKGTQAVRLAEYLKLPHISTGDLFRENISQQTPLGKRAKEYLDSGKLVPDEIVLDMFFDRISKSDAARGYILDGFPRTIPQAEALDKHLAKRDKLVVLNLDVSDDTIINRTLLRKRADDTPEVVKERLRAYQSQTAPLIEYYSKKGALRKIDGEKTPDEVFEQLKKALSSS